MAAAHGEEDLAPAAVPADAVRLSSAFTTVAGDGATSSEEENAPTINSERVGTSTLASIITIAAARACEGSLAPWSHVELVSAYNQTSPAAIDEVTTLQRRRTASVTERYGRGVVVEEGKGQDYTTAEKKTHKWSSIDVLCGYCETPLTSVEPYMCTGCCVVYYCGKPCQKRHWNEWHRVSCVASALSGAADAQERRRSCRVVSSISDCLICLAEFVDCARQTLLPCGHTFCTACLDSLGKAKGAQRACPLCRAPLPPSAKRLAELAERTIRKVATALGWAGGVGSGGECQWPSLSASQEGSVQDAIVMLEEAIDQVSGRMGAGGPGDGAVMGLLALAHVAHVAGAGCADAGAIGPGEGPPPRSTRFSTSYTSS